MPIDDAIQCPTCAGCGIHFSFCNNKSAATHKPTLSSDEAIQDLRRKLTGYPEGVGKVTFFRTDGRKVVIDNVKYDEIGVDNSRTAAGIVTLTVADENETIVHLPFVECWTVEF